jgi:hypothetical protein
VNKSTCERLTGCEVRQVEKTFLLVRDGNKILFIESGKKAIALLNEAFWKVRRQEALVRDNYTCQQCGAQRDLDVHHILPRGKRGTHALENLTTLCRRCHEAQHSRRT